MSWHVFVPCNAYLGPFACSFLCQTPSTRRLNRNLCISTYNLLDKLGELCGLFVTTEGMQLPLMETEVIQLSANIESVIQGLRPAKVDEKPHQAITSFQRVSLVFRPCPSLANDLRNILRSGER